MQIIRVLKSIKPFLLRFKKYIIISIFLTAVGAFLAQVNPLIINYSVNQVELLLSNKKGLTDGWNIVWFVLSVLIIKEILNIIAQFWQRFLGEKIKVLLALNLFNHAIEHTLGLSPNFFSNDDNKIGILVKRIEKGVEGLSKTIKNIFVDILPLFANAIVALIIMYSVNIWVGFAASFIVPIYFYLSYIQAKNQKGVRLSIQDLKEKRTDIIFKIFYSILIVKSFIREPFESEKHARINTELSDQEIFHHKTNHFFDSLKLFTEQIGVAIIFVITVIFVLDGSMKIGAIMLHLLLFNNVTSPIRHLHRIYDEFNEALTYSEGFFKLLDSTEKISNNGKINNEIAKGTFEISNVYFKYHAEQSNILDDINIEINHGKTTALVGLSGAGKTTLLKLLTRFYDPLSGAIYLDSIKMTDYDLQFLRKNIGIVFQENFIYDGTIYENIQYGDLEASENQIIDSAKKANLHNEVLKLKNGYKTNALHLSGGQKQRLAIARVFLKNPPILLLDEPTSSLDILSAEKIKDSIDAIKRNRTVLVISHNIAQIIDADYIYVMKSGKIIEHGEHEKLMKNGGHYFDIISRNMKTMKLEKLANSKTHST